MRAIAVPRIVTVLLLGLLLALLAVVALQGRTATADETLPVGIFEAPPFAIRDGNGGWDGIAVDLWRRVARTLGLQFVFQEMPVPDLLAALQNGELTAVVTAVATAEREHIADFSHPYFSSGLGIAIAEDADEPDWLVVLGKLVSWSFLKLVGLLLLILGIAGSLIWFFERRANTDHFHHRPAQGIADGMWWAAVTMTTVGYGDKAPKTPLGRVLAGVWMFTAVILIAFFTAHVTSTLTVSGLSGKVRGPSDLPHVRVGALQHSVAQSQMRDALGVAAAGYDSYAAGLEAVARGEIDAFIAGAPILHYEVTNRFHGRVRVLGASFMREDYAFALQLNSPLRKPVNEALLGIIASEEWGRVLRHYLGADH